MQIETTTTKTIAVTTDTIVSLVCEKFELDPKKVEVQVTYTKDERFPNDDRIFSAIKIISNETK